MTEELERRVLSRTAELARTNEELRRARDAAREAGFVRVMFLARLSHEVRTPLNHLLGYSEILEEMAREKGLTERLPDLEKIRDASRHLLAVFSDILDLAKLETGTVEMTLEDFDVGTLANEFVSSIRPLADRNGDLLTLNIANGAGTMKADRAKVRQALVNGLTNACRFSEKGEVELAIEREAADGREWIRFRIADHGVGMSTDAVSRLFDGFSRSDYSGLHRAGGTGLGLAVSKRFFEAMGGDIQVESHPGAGTTLTLRLPTEVELPAR